MSATPTHELCSIAHTQCASSRAQSAFHRAGGFLCSVTGWTREGAYFRSVAFSCRTRSVFHRTRSVFHRAGHFFRAVAGWTREHTKCVPSRREFFPFYTRAGRGRTLISVPWLFHAAREACFTADTEYLSPRTRSVLHRARVACFIAQVIFSVLRPGGRGKICLPFCGVHCSAVF